MELADIVRQIRAEAQTEVDFLKKAYDIEARKLDSDLDFEKARVKQRILSQAYDEIERLEREELGRASVDRKNELVNRKKELVDAVLKEAIERYMKSSKYEEFLKSSIRENQGKGIVVCVSRDDAAAAKVLNAAKIKPSFEDTGGGLIFRNGDVAVNKTIGVLMERKRAELERAASSALFG